MPDLFKPPSRVTGVTDVDHVFKETYPMHYIPFSVLMKMKRLRPHNEMVSEGLVKKWTPAMENRIIGVSHQWLGYREADPNGDHLRALQAFFTRCLAGQLTGFEDYWLHKLMCQTHTVHVSAKEWREFLLEAGIWIDLSCMPQIARGASDSVKRDARQALLSLPSYMERCAFLVAVVPACLHKDTGKVCNFRSWRTRGWCRLEFLLTILSPRDCRCLAVTGEEAQPFLLHPYDGIKLPPGEGAFSCCTLDHKLPCGTPIPCDRQHVRDTLTTMLDARVLLHREQCHYTEARFFGSLRATFLNGLPRRDGQRGKGRMCENSDIQQALLAESKAHAQSSSGLEALKQRLRWEPEDEDRAKKTGYTLLMCACMADDAEAVKVLTASRADPNTALRKDFYHLTYMNKGNTAIFPAMSYGSWGTVEALLNAGAKHAHQNAIGIDAFMPACCMANYDNVVNWLQRFPDWEINRNVPLLGMPAAAMGSLLGAGKANIVRTLVEYKATIRSKRRFGGEGGLLCIAAGNPDCDADMIETLIELRADPNEAWASPNAAWRTMLLGVRHRPCTRSHSNVLREISMLEGASPLHFVAKRHDLEILEVLMKAGARHEARNAQGRSPLDVAKDFNGGVAPPVLLSLLQGRQRGPEQPRLLGTRTGSKEAGHHKAAAAGAEEDAQGDRCGHVASV